MGGVLSINELDAGEILQILNSEIGLIDFLKIKEGDPMLEAVQNPAVSARCVEIPFEEGYDAWFKGLSASVRQNLRTAYNRLATDGLEYTFEVFAGDTLPTFPTKEIVSLYCRRHEERYGVRTSRFKRWFLEHQSFATRYYRFAENAYTSLLRINGRPAAFLSGLHSGKENGKVLTVPRLSINDEFKRYSPGMMLVNETIRQLAGTSAIRTLDLSQGEETYKYKLGGKPYHLYRFRPGE